ncbi:AbiJ-NTD4 domain-containing protein [Pseudomonas syringae]|uniref:AbiJ-NTD4 domain-containing protein n=1 Tax=Pseudomonas syringae TaxID=317 RepID=UPI000E327A31|nr:hypothetical protein [Pseudomonas syringae]
MSESENSKLSFSQRMGLAPAAKDTQIESIDNDLKNSLWNVLTDHYWSEYDHPIRQYLGLVEGSNMENLTNAIYRDFHKILIDAKPQYWVDLITAIKTHYFSMSWHRTYSFIEFIVGQNWRDGGDSAAENFNTVLERENSAYRFVNRKLMNITSKDEVKEIESAIESSQPYAGVKEHLQTSLGFMTNRENPDYRNSIKESISAVESLSRHLTGDASATLGQAIKVLERKHGLHQSLKAAFSALYGYTNDADGIRHSLMDDGKTLTQADARFMLICCSAFVNYAISTMHI